MDSFLSSITQHAVNYAIRSGIAITSGYAFQQCSRLLKTVKSHERIEIANLKSRLESKLCIISPAIDMIELIAARGNTSLDSAVVLTKSIRAQIQSLGVQLAKATQEEVQRQSNIRSKGKVQENGELKIIISSLKDLLTQIEDAVPLINLAITTSGVSLSTALPSTVSPSRLLQASMFLSTADSAYATSPGNPIQVGPVYTLSIYMLFDGHASRKQNMKDIRETTWKEVIHKARVKLIRVPISHFNQPPVSDETSTSHSATPGSVRIPGRCSPSQIPSDSEAHEFAYQLLIVEDLDDGRVHTVEDDAPQPGPFEDVSLAGIREVIPIHEISKIFYADTGKILNINSDGETNNPVLLLKRDVGANLPRRMMDSQEIKPSWEPDSDEENLDEDDLNSLPPSNSVVDSNDTSQAWKFPSSLDLTWIAFEVFTETTTYSDDEDEDSSAELEEPSPISKSSFNPLPTTPFNNHRDDRASDLKKNGSSRKSMVDSSFHDSRVSQLSMPMLRTSLSLLELLIRLSSLQQFQQCSHLAISDELLNFFLSESSSTGAGADSERRKNMRTEARRRVGFDPYAESPIQFRGERNWHEAKVAADEDVESNEDDLPPLRSYSQSKPSHSYGSSAFHGTEFSASLEMSPGIDSSPSLRVRNRSGHNDSMADKGKASSSSERRLRVGLERKPFPRETSLLRSESDSTLGTSPGDVMSRHNG